KSDEDKLALSKDYPSTSAQDPLNKIPILQQESNRLDLDNQNLNDQNLVILNGNRELTLSKDATLNFQAQTSDHELVSTDQLTNWKNMLKKNYHLLAIIAVASFLIKIESGKIILIQLIATGNTHLKHWSKNLVILFSEQIRKSNIYQTTEKAYKELKIEHGVLVKNLKDLEINHKNTKKELETATKENTNLDKKLTLNKQELATANKENANLDKKFSLKEQELETANKKNANLDKKLSIKEQELESAKKENVNLDKKFTLKKQELETAKKEIMNLDKKLSINEKELEAAKKENANLNKKLTEKEHYYKESQTKIKDLNKKIESLEKEVRILDKQRIVGEERKQVIRELQQAYKELKETFDKIKQEKIEKEIKEHQEILEKADKSLNDNKEC
ncbi:22645_t:CDS:2, partial [Dentiscutata erythropus]